MVERKDGNGPSSRHLNLQAADTRIYDFYSPYLPLDRDVAFIYRGAI